MAIWHVLLCVLRVLCVLCVCPGLADGAALRSPPPSKPLGLGVASAIPLGPRMAPGQQNHQPRTVARVMKMLRCGTIKGCPRSSWDPLGVPGGLYQLLQAAPRNSRRRIATSLAARCRTHSHACHRRARCAPGCAAARCPSRMQILFQILIKCQQSHVPHGLPRAPEEVLCKL